MNQVLCFQCKQPFIESSCKYWFDEKFYIKGSISQLPMCSCQCGVDYYDKNGFDKKSILKNVKGS